MNDEHDVVWMMQRRSGVGGKLVLCTQNFVYATQICLIPTQNFMWILHKILCEKAMYEILVMRKERIATSVTASAIPCTLHMHQISESLNKVNLSILQERCEGANQAHWPAKGSQLT